MKTGERVEELAALGRERVLILDGAMGTQIQDLKLDEEGYRGERFADWPSAIKGNNDILNLTTPPTRSRRKPAHRAAWPGPSGRPTRRCPFRRM